MSDPTPLPTIGTEEKQPVDILRWPNLEHRFTKDSPVSVNVASPINVGVTTPVNLGFTETPANVNMNIITPNAVGVNLLGSKEPVALRFVITEPIVAKSDYTIQLKINGNEVFSVSIAGTTTLFTQGPEE
jgi:hypothetical protein